MRLTAYNGNGAALGTWTIDRPLTVGEARREILLNGAYGLDSVKAPIVQGWVVDGVGIFTWHEASATLQNPMQFACWHKHDECTEPSCTACGIHFEEGCVGRDVEAKELNRQGHWATCGCVLCEDRREGRDIDRPEYSEGTTNCELCNEDLRARNYRSRQIESICGRCGAIDGSHDIDCHALQHPIEGCRMCQPST